MAYPGNVEKAAHNVIGQDNFGKAIADGTTNIGDLAAHHPMSPERYRLLKGGTRQLPHYGSVTGFSDEVDHYRVSPGGGETWEFRTSSQFSYHVGYVMVPSFSFRTNQSLQGDDIVTVSYGTSDLPNVTGTDLTTGSADGWILSFTSDLDDDQGRFGIYRNGSQQVEEIVDFEKPIDVLRRFQNACNWYGVGSAILEETFVDGNKDQQNPVKSEIGVEDSRGPETGNKHIEYAVKTDASTTGLQLEVGSSSMITLGGNIRNIERIKPEVTTENIGNANTWEPLYAIRKDSDFGTVSLDLDEIEILKYSAADDVEIVAVAVDPSKTNAGTNTAFAQNSPYSHSYNSAVESTSDVTEIPNTSGTQTDPGTSTTPGGHTVGHAVLTTDKGNSIGGIEQGIQARRRLNDDDVIVFCGKSATTGNVTFRIKLFQNW